jgi:hypothetical protein
VCNRRPAILRQNNFETESYEQNRTPTLKICGQKPKLKQTKTYNPSKFPQQFPAEAAASSGVDTRGGPRPMQRAFNILKPLKTPAPHDGDRDTAYKASGPKIGESTFFFF